MKKTPSLQSRLLNISLKSLVKGLFEEGLNLEKLRKNDIQEPDSYVRRKCRIESYERAGITGTWLYPRKSAFRGTILHFHGGAYVSGPSLLHWRMLSYICRATKYRCLLINYPKAPEFPYPAALTAMESIYLDLQDSTDPRKIVFMGDSAGGGLALALTITLRDKGKPLPLKVALLSPWLDLTLSSQGITEQAEKDNMLALAGLRDAADFYSGKEDKSNPLISPLYGNLEGLPPLLLQIGTRELLLPECRIFHNRTISAGQKIKYEEWEGMFHVWMLNIPYLPEATDAVSSIISWLET